MSTGLPARIDRRAAIKWILAAGAGSLLIDPSWLGAAAPDLAPGSPAGPAQGYGVDPDLMKVHRPGDLWPLTFTDTERRLAAALCDIIVPAQGQAPCASALGVQDFIDEWVSAPYPANREDRGTITGGLAWLERESNERFGSGFDELAGAQRLALCDMAAAGGPGSRFFRRFRDLAASGYFTTPEGLKDLGYVGNVPLASFDGPPPELVRKLGLADEVKW